MATNRVYTTIEQSRKLAEILPLESADMYYGYGKDKPEFLPLSDGDVKCLSQPCWSLAALLNVIPSGQVNRMANSEKWEASSWNDSDFEPTYYVEDYDNPVDACYETILKLNELNLL